MRNDSTKTAASRALVRSAATLMFALLFAATGSASGLRIDGDPGHPAIATSYVRIANDGATTLSRIRTMASTGESVACAARTTQGRPFTGALDAGDSVRCHVAGRRGDVPVTVVATARDARGLQVVRTMRLGASRGAIPPQAALVLSAGSIHQDSDSDGLLDAGEVIDYHYTVFNVGTLTIDGISLVDITGQVVCESTTLAAGSHTICTSSYEIDAEDDAIGEVLNIADLTGVDVQGAPVIAGDLVLRLDLDGDAGISVFKDPLLIDDADDSGFASAGDLVRYNFVVKNTDAQALSAVNLVEPDPSLIDTPITCAATTLGGAPFAGVGTGVLPSLDTVLCTAEYTIRPSDAANGAAQNLVEATAQPAVGPEVFATGASTIVIPTAADVTLAKSLAAESGTVPGVAEPGETLTYTITLTNAGGSNAPAFGVTDVLDPNTVFVSADNGGVHAGGVVTWNGIAVPANDVVVLTVTVAVADPLPPGVTQVANLAHETGTQPAPCPPASAGCVVTPTIGAVSLSKSVEDANGDGLAQPGEVLTYTIVLDNAGGSDVTGFDVTDRLDASTSFISADNGGAYAGGFVTWTGLSIPAAGSLVLTLQVQVIDPLPLAITAILNLVYETGVSPPDCAADPQPAGCALIPVAPVPQLAIMKTVDATTVEPGGTVIYTVTVSNTGTADLVDVQIIDALPDGITGFEWTCAASGGASCPQANGTGAISQLIADFPSGGELVYTIAAQVAQDPPESIVNVALVTPTGLATCIPGGTPAPCSADVEVTPEAGEPPPPPSPVQPVPFGAPWALVLMAVLLAGVASRTQARARLR